MKTKEINQVIKNYQPHHGFFNLSRRPAEMPKTEYAKILKAQNFLAAQTRNAKYLKQHDPAQWEKLKTFAAELQQIILRHWDIEEMEATHG